MPRYRLTLEYAGTRYSGWQIQKNARTVQGELHHALKAGFPPGRLESYGAGRTDAGVHALGQVAHVDLAAEIAPAALLARINDGLPHDINVLEVERVSPRFHARHSAVARSYLYQIALRRTAFAKPYVWWVRDEVDVDAMRDAADRFIGLSDFRSFTDDDPEEKSTRVLLERLTIAPHGALVLVRVVGLALSLEDGTAPRRGARRGRTGRPPPGGCALDCHERLRAAGTPDGTSLGSVPRARLLPAAGGGLAAGAGSASGWWLVASG